MSKQFRIAEETNSRGVKKFRIEQHNSDDSKWISYCNNRFSSLEEAQDFIKYHEVTVEYHYLDANFEIKNTESV